MKYKYPFRIGKSTERAVLDAEGKEVIVFKPGDEQLALDLVRATNTRYEREHQYEINVKEAFEVKDQERFWHSLFIDIDSVKQITTVIVGRDLSTTKPFPDKIENNKYDLFIKETIFIRDLELGVYELYLKKKKW